MVYYRITDEKREEVIYLEDNPSEGLFNRLSIVDPKGWEVVPVRASSKGVDYEIRGERTNYGIRLNGIIKSLSKGINIETVATVPK